jgi:hypothetical protein
MRGKLKLSRGDLETYLLNCLPSAFSCLRKEQLNALDPGSGNGATNNEACSTLTKTISFPYSLSHQLLQSNPAVLWQRGRQGM